MDPDLTDAEIDRICTGYTQNAAKIRHLGKMGLNVRRKPNGRPLVNRTHYDRVTSGEVRGQAFAEPQWSVT